MNSNRTFRNILLGLWLVITSIALPGFGQSIFYVDSSVSGANDGSSWTDAFIYLQDALDVAITGDEIWVAAGTYYPTSDYGLGIGDRGKHFRMINDVAIYGGFPYTGNPDWPDRDPNTFETILSGNIGVPEDPNDNCYHVFYHPDGIGMDASAVLEGFTITAGNADGTDLFNSSGGGIYNYENNNPTVINCTFRGNSANWGGGMCNFDNNSPTVTGCTFSDNSANNLGGGMCNYRNNSPTVTGCTFSGNSAKYGGGMCNYGNNSLTVTGCIFWGNSADGSYQHGIGGGMYNYYDNSSTLMSCTFTGNSADYLGGGMYNKSSSPTVTGCTFTGNSAEIGGGGMVNEFFSSPTLTSCTFTGNLAEYCGGLGNTLESSPTLIGCTFTGNLAEYCGGLGNWNDSSPTLSNCTFIENDPDGIDSRDSTTVQVQGLNNIISDRWVGESCQITGDGTVHLDPCSIIDLDNALITCNLSGAGIVQVGLESELTIGDNSVVDFGEGGRFLCDGLLRVKDQAIIRNANINVTRASFEGDVDITNSIITAEAGSPYGQFFIEGSVTIIGNDIHADGDRYMDLDPSVFQGLMQDNRIFVTITEGVGQSRGGLLELRGQPDLLQPSCDPNAFFCQVDPDTIPLWDPNNWRLEELKLVQGAKLNLTNRFDFHAPFDEGGNDEVLYVKNLIMEEDSILNTAFNKIYYENFNGDPNVIENKPLLGFSLNNIAMDSVVEFLTRITHNNYYDNDPNPPDLSRIHVERIPYLDSIMPDPNGIMQMRNIGSYDARAKGLFAKSNEREILIQFEYRFCTEDTELVIYLTDVPELLDHNDPERQAHYLEVGHLYVPPAGRPGAPGSGRMGVFRKSVNQEHLDFVRGTRIEFELIGPDGTCILIDNWDPWVYCAYCMDTDGEMGVTATDYLTVAGEYGKKSSDTNEFGQFITCLDSILCEEGYVNINDLLVWDWLDFQTENVGNLCFEIPLTPTVSPQNPASLPSWNLPHPLPWQGEPVEINAPLLIAGKRYHRISTWEADYLSDRLYGFDEEAGFIEGPEQVTKDRLNGRLMRDYFGETYQLNLEDGLVRLSDEHPVIEPGIRTYPKPEPWYHETDTIIHVGLQGSGQSWWGRPILDVAFDAQGFAYVVPVVVEPANHEPYLAAAKLQLDPNESLSYSVEQVYASTPDWHDNLDPNHLREIKVDNEGNVYLLNNHDINSNDILWVYDNLGNLISLTELQQPNIGIQAPLALHLSRYDNSTIYLASSQNAPDADSVTIYAFPRESLPSPTSGEVRQIMIEGMGHVTDITEDPSTGIIWVIGFTMETIPDYVPVADPPFYRPYMAKIPYGGSGPIQAKDIGSNCNLTLPLSIAWMGSLYKCGGADLNNSGEVNLPDLQLLMNHWLEEDTDPNWLEKTDLDNNDTIDLGDFAVMGQYWLETDCISN
jgi:parallel beta helix pectate lyase-like protein/dockerin type I repeat protein